MVVPAPISTSFWISDPGGLRHLQMAVRPEEDEAVAVLADAASRMDQDVVADQRALNGRARADVAVPADPDIGADHRARADDGPGADLDVGADHRQRFDDHAIFQMRARVDDGGSINSRCAEPGLRTQRIAVELARDLDEFAERMRRAQHGDMGRDGRLEARCTRQAPALVEASWSAYFRLSKNVRCIGPASSSDASPLTIWPPRAASTKCACVSAASRSQRRRRRLFKEGRLRHSTRRGPAGDRKSAPGLVDQNRAPPMLSCAFFPRTGTVRSKTPRRSSRRQT